MNKSEIMEIYLMRHGESEMNEVKFKARTSELTDQSSSRYSDPSLNERGTNDSLNSGIEFRRLGITFNKVICSPQRRSLQTAENVLKGMEDSETKAVVNSQIFEYGGSDSLKILKRSDDTTVDYKGLTKSQIQAEFPFTDVSDEGLTEEGWFFKGSVETTEEARGRAQKFFKWIKEECPKTFTDEASPDIQRCLVISHAKFFSHVHGHIMNTIFPDESKYFHLAPCGVSILEINKEGLIDMPVQNIRFCE